MEINRLDNAIGAVALADIIEGSMVVLTNDGNGNLAARVPADSTEAADARWVAVWKQLNTPFPGPLAYPSIEWSMRPGGFDQAQNNSPMTQQVWLTPPNVQVGTTIPSGYDLVLQQGVHTIESGRFVASPSLVPGAKLEALNTGDDSTDAGKLSYTATDSATVAYVVKYDATAQKLTFMTRAL